jgi:hypothetical protein
MGCMHAKLKSRFCSVSSLAAGPFNSGFGVVARLPPPGVASIDVKIPLRDNLSCFVSSGRMCNAG